MLANLASFFQILKPVSSLDPVNILSLCFGYCSLLVQWDCYKCNVIKVLKAFGPYAFHEQSVHNAHSDAEPDERYAPADWYRAIPGHINYRFDPASVFLSTHR